MIYLSVRAVKVSRKKVTIPTASTLRSRGPGCPDVQRNGRRRFTSRVPLDNEFTTHTVEILTTSFLLNKTSLIAFYGSTPESQEQYQAALYRITELLSMICVRYGNRGNISLYDF